MSSSKNDMYVGIALLVALVLMYVPGLQGLSVISGLIVLGSAAYLFLRNKIKVK